MASSYRSASWEPVTLPNGKPKKKEGRQVYRVLAADGVSVRYHIGYLGSPTVLELPHGFETDFGSFPRLVRWLIPKGIRERSIIPAAFHDLMREDERYTLYTGDSLFGVLLDDMDVPSFWRDAFVCAVRSSKSRLKINPPFPAGPKGGNVAEPFAAFFR